MFIFLLLGIGDMGETRPLELRDPVAVELETKIGKCMHFARLPGSIPDADNTNQYYSNLDKYLLQY